MDLSLKDYYFDKFLYYSINNKCHRSFKRHKKEIKEYINKIVDDHNDHLLKESFVNYLTDDNLYMKLGELATNDKYLIYELIAFYYQELIKDFSYSTANNEIYVIESDLTINLDLATKDALTKANLLFLDMCRMNDINFYYFALMKMTVFYILTYCYINNCMDKYDDLIDYYKDDIYKIKDEIIMNGIDVADNNNVLIDIISNGLINRNKKLIK